MCIRSVWKQPACNGKNPHTHFFYNLKNHVVPFNNYVFWFLSSFSRVISFIRLLSFYSLSPRALALSVFIQSLRKGGPQGRAREQPMAALPCPLTLCKRGPLVDLSFPSFPARKEKQELATPPLISLLHSGVNVVRQEHTFTSWA